MKMSLLYIGQQITIFGECSMFLSGIFGNIMNILIFSTAQTNPGTFYFLAASMINIIYFIGNLSFRILSVGYNLDFTINSVWWCKLRNYRYIMLGPISYTCVCLVTILYIFIKSSYSTF
ncbi:hypothetical protein I4U23_011576 [Adineta vaga]|nr:hypothetical protein I4U23_011576 [Adineta vaga]